MERSNLYGFLATVFRAEVTPSLLEKIKGAEFQGALAAAGAVLDGDLLGRPQEELLEDLSVEYARLFLGPGKHVSPYASVHLGGEDGTLWGATTAAVKRFIESTGFEFRSDYRGLPDHVSVELEFMEMLASEEAKAWQSGDRDVASRALEVQGEFLDRHLAPWLPAFRGEVVDNAALSFYREMVRLMADFVESERGEITRRRHDATSAGAA